MLLNASLRDNCEELLERLILTVKIEKIMQKNLRKKGTLSEVLRKTNEEESTHLQISGMWYMYMSHAHNVAREKRLYVERRTFLTLYKNYVCIVIFIIY